MEPKPQKKLKSMMTENEGKESDAEYDNDDFEKEDMVKMAEPKGQNKKHMKSDKLTKDSSNDHTVSNNNSLLREISERSKLEAIAHSSSLPPVAKS